MSHLVSQPPRLNELAFDRQTHYFIRYHIGDSFINIIADRHLYTADLWSNICELYSAYSQTSVHELRKQLYDTALGKQSILQYVESTLETTRKIAELCREPVLDLNFAMIFLHGLPGSYTAIKTIMNSELDDPHIRPPSPSQVLRRLGQRETELQNVSHGAFNGEAYTQRPANQPPLGTPKPKGSPKPGVKFSTCSYCKEPGHHISECPKAECRQSKHYKGESDKGNTKPRVMIAHDAALKCILPHSKTYLSGLWILVALDILQVAGNLSVTCDQLISNQCK